MDEHFGDVAKLRELVDAAHARGLKVIQDQVANHTGPYHPWVQDPPTPTWFNGTEAEAPRQHLADLDARRPPRHAEQAQKATLEGWFIDILPDLNQDDEETARYIIQNTLWWVGVTRPRRRSARTRWPYVPPALLARLDGGDQARVPAAAASSGSCSTATRRWCRSSRAGAALRRHRLRDRRAVRLPAVLPAARAPSARGGRCASWRACSARDRLYPDPSQLVTFLGLHDVPRFLNEPGATTAGLKLAYTFLLTTRGIPLVYYGDEIALPGGSDPDNRRDFPGGFAGDPRNAFSAAGRTPEQQAVFAHVQRLNRLRAATPSCAAANAQPARRGAADGRSRGCSAGGAVVVALNNAAAPATIELDAALLPLAEGSELEDALGGSRCRVEAGRLRSRSARVAPSCWWSTAEGRDGRGATGSRASCRAAGCARRTTAQRCERRP